jgi:2-methylfumaryl-CoA hydratase
LPPTIALSPQTELAPAVPFEDPRILAPAYGRYLEQMTPGQVFSHPRGVTIGAGMARAFAATFLEANPLYLNREFARSQGFDDVLLSPQLLFNVVLSLGVQNDSEKAIANLGYYGARFLRPAYPGDTLRAATRVMEVSDRGPGRPGIVNVRTIGVNQRGEVVLQYERKIMIGHSPAGAVLPATAGASGGSFPWVDQPVVELPESPVSADPALTGAGAYLEDFATGDVIVHGSGRSVTDEHMAWSYGVGNTHPLHSDRLYSTGLSGAMSGEPIVYGGLVFAWLAGLAGRDTSENALWDLGFSEGYHTQPTVSGDTLGAISRVLAVEPGAAGAGVLTVQLIGVKNLTAADALDRWGGDLFIKETAKRRMGRDKIPAKVFEVERQLLVRRREA